MSFLFDEVYEYSILVGQIGRLIEDTLASRLTLDTDVSLFPDTVRWTNGSPLRKTQSLRSKTRWFQLFFIFYPTWGRWSNLTSIFVTYGLIETTPRKTLLPRRGGVCVRQRITQAAELTDSQGKLSFESPPVKTVKKPVDFFPWIVQRKMSGTLGMVPLLFNPPEKPFKRGYTQHISPT